MSTYEEIKDSVEFGFEEYVENNNYTAAQASARILEEDWWLLNEGVFSKTTFFICLALKSLENNVIPDFVVLKLNIFLNELVFEDYIKAEDVEQLQNDIILYKERMEKRDFKILETDETWKGRLEYIFSLKREDF
ncbi:hypothetical protein [Paenibacillus antibioticophila]|uniref:hypothetical protein n=1 Tax=Paenibacillus antibioticophila TaxID=1274374 RepID=UPI0005C918B7|nr:hypothetical protein [Paenibacillus antibioticophila]